MVSRFIYADHINVPEIIEKGGRTYRILHDHLGSPRFVVDTASGEIAQELHYDAWGNLVFDSNPGFQPFGFAGGLYDTHTKLIRFGARDYDPQVGRWMSKDPILFSGSGPNLLAYSFNDSINFLDSNGLSCNNPCPDFPKGCGDPPRKGDKACPNCNPVRIQAALESALVMLSRFYSLCQNADVGTKTTGYVKCKLMPARGLPSGWYFYGNCQWPPKEFHCSGDPCVDFCACVHEWFHFVDQRAFDLWHWSVPQIRRFLEAPAYRVQIECLSQYL
ncbi:MAG: RHS repeat domain-containing protein [Acidobacteriota bacterium]